MDNNKRIDQVFKALADSKRREIFNLLITATTALTLSQLTNHFEISRQGVTKHIGLLKDAGLVSIKSQGRERLCIANPEPLNEVKDWLAAYDKFWDSKLDGLSDFLDDKV